MSGGAPGPSARWPPPEKLALDWHAGATLLPLDPDPEAPVPFRLGAYDATGRFLEHARAWRSTLASEILPPCPAEEECTGAWAYGGVLWDHYGHFLLEALARAWALRALPGLPVLWHRRVGHARLTAWQSDILDLIGLGGREHRVVTRPVRVARLAVAQAGFVMWRYFHPRQAAVLAAHPFRVPERGRRLWLSRSGMPEGHARVDGETALEQALAAEGWTVLRPETLDVAAQLAALQAAEAIAGFAGSAFHTLMLGAEVRARIVIVPRGSADYTNYEMIAAARGFDQAILPARLEHVSGEKSLASYRLTEPDRLHAALREAVGA